MLRSMLLGLFVLFTLSNAKIISGVGTLQMNTAINFTSAKVFSPKITAHCSTSIDSADLMFFSHDCGTCMYYCPCEIINSVKPFYTSKLKLSEIISLKSLDLKDTNSFLKIDTTRYCKSPWLLIDTNNSCYFPGSCWKINWTSPLIAQTSQKKYVLVSMTTVIGTSCDPMMPPAYADCRNYTQVVVLHWYLQTDGTTDFYGITSTINSPVQSIKSCTTNGELFDILGRKIPATELTKTHIKIHINNKTNLIRPLILTR